jgi:hypothetical protein
MQTLQCRATQKSKIDTAFIFVVKHFDAHCRMAVAEQLSPSGPDSTPEQLLPALTPDGCITFFNIFLHRYPTQVFSAFSKQNSF